MANQEKKVLSFIKQIAEKHGYRNSQIDIQPMVAGGQMSHLFAVQVTESKKEDLKLVAKITNLKPEAIAESAVFGNIYQMECKFYSVIAKKFEGIYNKHGIAKEHRLALPACYGHDETRFEEIIILENLVEKSYKSISQKEILTWEYVASSMVQLAKFHAVGAAFRIENQEYFDKFMTPLEFDMFGEDYLKLISQPVEDMISSMHDKYKERFQNWFMAEWKVMAQKFHQDKNFLIQYDCRHNNFMYREKNGKVESVMLDFQFCRRGNPVQDLMYFIFIGTDQEFRKKHYKQLFDFYYSQLTLELQRLEINIEELYPRKAFDQNINDFLAYGVFLALVSIPLLISETSNPNASDGSGVMNVKPKEKGIERMNGIISDLALWGVI